MSKSKCCDKCGKLLTMFGNCVDCYQPCEPAEERKEAMRRTSVRAALERNGMDASETPDGIDQIDLITGALREPASPKPEMSDREWANTEAAIIKLSEDERLNIRNALLLGLAEGRRRVLEEAGRASTKPEFSHLHPEIVLLIAQREEAAAREMARFIVEGDPRYQSRESEVNAINEHVEKFKQRRAGKC